MSDELTTLLGYLPQELAGVPARSLVVENAELGVVDGWMEELELDGELHGHLTWIAKDGIRIPYSFVSRVVWGSEPLHVAFGWPEGPGGAWPAPPIPPGRIDRDSARLMTLPEAGRYAHVHPSTIKRASERGELRILGSRGRYRVLEGELARWVDRGMP